jgi:hypothetical protein
MVQISAPSQLDETHLRKRRHAAAATGPRPSDHTHAAIRSGGDRRSAARAAPLHPAPVAILTSCTACAGAHAMALLGAANGTGTAARQHGSTARSCAVAVCSPAFLASRQPSPTAWRTLCRTPPETLCISLHASSCCLRLRRCRAHSGPRSALYLRSSPYSVCQLGRYR